MFLEFKNHLTKKYNSLTAKKILLAVSSGIDSMVLLDLVQKLNLSVSVAHCNFKLRGEESDSDEKFITDYCNQKNIPFYTKKFETEKYASENKKSIQISARELRYKWFFELKEKHHFDYIVTAHHLDDSLETFFINLSRGTGIEGLVGIRENENIIRPLLQFSREEIQKYATENNVAWREDSSNSSDKYLRNKIRHRIVPLFKEINPEFLNSFSKTSHYLQEIQNFSDEVSDKILNELVVEEIDFKYLKIKSLINFKNYKFILYKWLYPYGFSAWKNIYNLIDSQSGKFIETEDFRLLKNRNELILSEKNKAFSEKEFSVSENGINNPIYLKISEVSEIPETNNTNEIYVDKNLLNFPLLLGKWKEGQYFYPFGMQGKKKKKVSKFFKDEKFSVLEKESSWILYSDNQIVWIVGKRMDERFKVTKNTTSILKIEYLS